MNNRYICKAKRKDNGEWVTGYYVFRRKRSGIFGQIISELDFDRHLIIDLRGNSHEVIPETVVRCTGLDDKNGKWIFEGDVFEGNKIDGKKKLYKFWYDDENGGFVYGTSYKSGYRLSIAKWCFSAKNIEVIGNIHDNPELLEAEK